MKRKLIISAAIIVLALAGNAIFILLQQDPVPPGFVFADEKKVSSESNSEAQYKEDHITTEPIPQPEEIIDTTVETNEGLSIPQTLYTSYDPLHSFCITFNNNTIEVNGVYRGDTVTHVSLSDDKSTKVQYFGERIVAELSTNDIDTYDQLLIHFDSDWSLPVHITFDENGVPCALITDAKARSELALNNPLTIPAENVAEYILPDATTEERTAILEQVCEISANICNGLDDDYDKARAIAMWISENIYYDYPAYETEVTTETLSLGQTLELQRSVCGGYANLYAAMCQAQGITCHVVKGTVIQNGGTFAEEDHESPSHEWNVIELDGRHIWVDTLWNTTNSYNGKYHSGRQTYRYFDISDECMAINHRAERIEIRSFLK